MKSGRFVLYFPTNSDRVYITSFDTWEDCNIVFPIYSDVVLFDTETGRRWDKHSKYRWEDAAT